MLRSTIKTGLKFSLFSITELLDQDKLSKETETERKADISQAQNESGLSRVRQMFQVDEFGDLSKEVVTILHVGAMSLFVGALYGGVMYSRVTYVDFIKNNQATAFHDHFEAKKKLQEAVTKSFGRGAWKWGWRLSLFCSSFVGISTTLSVYRGKSGILEYVAAGLISGSLYKFNGGPRAWIVGGALGSALGLVGGCATLALLSLTGMSMDEVRYWQYHWKHERNDYFNKGVAEYLSKEQGEIYHQHDKKIGESGKTLENLEKVKN